MGTSKETIRDWFKDGVKDKQRPRYMIVLCDTFDHDDYPTYQKTEEQARALMKSPGDMQRVMEVYDLQADMEKQLAMQRCFALT